MQEFKQKIYTLLSFLGEGKMTTYGKLAKEAGFPYHSRYVGKILSKLPKDTRLPWHRVVNAQGKISLSGSSFTRQKILLAQEGIEVSQEGKVVNFKDYLD